MDICLLLECEVLLDVSVERFKPRGTMRRPIAQNERTLWASAARAFFFRSGDFL